MSSVMFLCQQFFCFLQEIRFCWALHFILLDNFFLDFVVWVVILIVCTDHGSESLLIGEVIAFRSSLDL
jgi:hypothetical protein